MDFFSTGGFQQLFSDLNDTQLDGHWLDLENQMDGTSNFDSYGYCVELPIDNNLTCADDPFVLATLTNEQTLLELQSDWSQIAAESPCSNTNDNNISLQYTECTAISEGELQFTLDHLLSSPPAIVGCHVDSSASLFPRTLAESNSSDDVSNNCAYNNMSDSSSVDSTTFVELETAALITREMADWEEKFLDNYIEIPELIDFLPEKTPLCTETCEHFLHESSKNLKLHRKARGTKRSNDSTNCCEERTAAGFACTFGTCDKIYAKPAHLKAHLRRHMGEKPYTCDWPECTWKFSRSDELARHRRSHSGVKPYKCNYCMKCFARSDHLTKHRKVHERRLLAASKAGKAIDGVLPHSVFTVRPGRKRKNQI